MTAIPAGTHVIDPTHSEVAFSVRHAGISKVRGSFKEFEGTIAVGEDLNASSVDVTIKSASVDTGDEARDNHLRGTDFWDAESNPEWTFVSTSVSGDEDDFTITGDLTINGVTRSVELSAEFNGAATDPFGANRVGFSATTTISRKDFGLTFNVALETGGVLVGDKITITLEVEAIMAEANATV